MKLIEDEEQARRLARAILSDIALYNVEKVEEGIKNDTLFEILAEEIEEGRRHFLTKVSPDINPDLVYGTAIVDVLVKRAFRLLDQT